MIVSVDKGRFCRVKVGNMLVVKSFVGLLQEIKMYDLKCGVFRYWVFFLFVE